MAPYKGYLKDGRTKEPEWISWQCMMRRCYEKNWRDYQNYGKRGIRVHQPWHDYQNFKRDMGKRPSSEHSLDRIDVNGNYEPKNCRWANRQQQMANRRNCRRVTYGGRTMCASEWAREIGISQKAFVYRIKHWPIEKVMSQREIPPVNWRD